MFTTELLDEPDRADAIESLHEAGVVAVERTRVYVSEPA